MMGKKDTTCNCFYRPMRLFIWLKIKLFFLSDSLSLRVRRFRTIPLRLTRTQEMPKRDLFALHCCFVCSTCCVALMCTVSLTHMVAPVPKTLSFCFAHGPIQWQVHLSKFCFHFPDVFVIPVHSVSQRQCLPLVPFLIMPTPNGCALAID